MIGVLLWSILKRQPPFQDMPSIHQYRDAHNASGIRGPPLRELPDYAAPFLPILRACFQPLSLGDNAFRPTVPELLTMFRDIRVPAGNWPSPFEDCRRPLFAVMLNKYVVLHVFNVLLCFKIKIALFVSIQPVDPHYPYHPFKQMNSWGDYGYAAFDQILPGYWSIYISFGFNLLTAFWYLVFWDFVVILDMFSACSHQRSRCGR
jgi:hypothetical protein